jgi:hypothetical protein
MQTFIKTVIAALLISATSAAWADDPASLFIVRQQGVGTVGLTLSTEEQTQTDTVSFGSRSPMVGTNGYRYQTSEAILSGSIGVGYGFELFADVPNTFQHQTTSDGGEEHLKTGFGDADFGFKYRLFGSAFTDDRAVLRATFTHHSSSVGTDQIALYYAHVFAPNVTLGLQAFYEYEQQANGPGQQYRSDQYGGSGLLFWNVAPNVALIPFVRIYNTESYETVPAEVTSQTGVQLSYFWSRSWSLTPTLSYLHTAGGRVTIDPMVSVNYGARDGGLATLLLQYQF